MSWPLPWRRRERELDDELLFHIEAHTKDLIADGVAPEEARRQALAIFGGTAPIKERLRDVRGFPFLRDLGRDVRGGVRMLRHHAGFAAVTIGLLALGIGVNTAMFTVLDAVIFRPLPYANADRLVLLSMTPKDFDGVYGMPSEVFADFRDVDRLLDGMAAFTNVQAALLVPGGEPTPIGVRAVTSGYFSTLGTNAAQGRTLMTGDETPGRDAVIVLSDGLWRRWLGSRPDVIGTYVTVDGVVRRVVGVMPPNTGALLQSDAWLPMILHPAVGNEEWPTVIGRLRPDTSREQAAAELEALQGPHIKAQGDDPTQWAASVLPLKDYVVGDVRASLFALASAVGFVLLIVCSNVASLFLARTEERARELAVRAALGAGRARLTRQLLTESLVVSAAGGAVGVLVTLASTRAIAAMAASAALPLLSTVNVDRQALAFAAGLCLLSTLIFGLAPAWRSRRLVGTSMALGRTTTLGDSRFHGLLVIAQVALSLVLLVGAGLTIRSIRNANTGFPTQHLGTLTVNVPPSSYPSTAGLASFHQQVLTTLVTLPGVRRAAAVNFVPFGNNMLAGQFTLDTGRPWPDNEMAYNLCVSDAYFQTMGVRLQNGRSFSTADRPDSGKVAIVSESFAREFWPGESAIGHRLSETDRPTDRDWLTVVGVVDDAKQSNIDQDIPLTVYRPIAQAPQRLSIAHMTFVLRTDGDPHDIAPSLRTVLHNLAPGVPVPAIRSMDELIGERLISARFQARLLGTFALTALALTMVGIFGVLAYAVSRRTRELGVRLALGASRARIIISVLRRSLLLALAGVAIGSAGAWGLATILQDVLFGVRPSDPLTFVVVAGVLVLGAVGAAAIPASRASRVDPVVALRSE
ncbi:MAG TPA: ABC transporter permease [Vicinamibacterales bacterium]|jgi:predicted permease|nr:ABC transporter permease [Vicinamibacterales bacterium]